MLEFLKAIADIRPTWIIWENVPGVLSIDNGRAFGTLLGSLAQLGYGFSHRVLDAQFFRVAQRRRRVFVVGCAGGQWQRAASVLFEPESLSGYPQTSRDKRAELTQGSGAGSAYAIAGNIIGRKPRNGGNGLGVQEEVGYTLTATDQQGVSIYLSNGSDVVGTLCAGDHKGVGSQYVSDGKLICISPGFSKRPDQQLATNADNLSYALTAGVPPNICQHGVRRLTPLECERLQGFPDNWTALSEETPDTPRYKALGNSMAVPVIEWLGMRIKLVESILE